MSRVNAMDFLFCVFSRGETPAEADVNLLDTARKVELYGIRMNPAKVIFQISLYVVFHLPR